MIRTILLVAIGGGVGSALRLLVSRLVQENVAAGSFPLATMTVNVVGCLLIGLFYGMSSHGALGHGDSMKTLLTTGLCGGFTTFSTFCNDSMLLIRGGQPLTALAYTACSLIVGLAAVAAGYWLAE